MAMNKNAAYALAEWRKNNTDPKTGKVRYCKRTTEEVLEDKRKELSKLLEKVDALKADIVRLDKKVNSKKIDEMISGYTFEELSKLLGK